MTLETKIAELKTQYPTIRIGSDETGYTELSAADYDAKITEWANNQIAAEMVEQEKLATAQALVDAKTSGITHARDVLGFTQAQAEAMFP